MGLETNLLHWQDHILYKKCSDAYHQRLSKPDMKY